MATIMQLPYPFGMGIVDWNDCPECDGTAITGEQYEIETGRSDLRIMADVLCPECRGGPLGSAPAGESCPECLGWRFTLEPLDGRELIVPCGCAEGLGLLQPM